MPGESLSLPERVEIEVGVARGDSARALADAMARPPSTVTRELRRNGGRGHYRAVDAQARADHERSRPRLSLLEADTKLASHVETRLRALDSPMTISIELARGVYPEQCSTVSHETIYQAVYAQGRGGLDPGLHRCLHRGRRRRKPRRVGPASPMKRGPLGDFSLIFERPAEAEGRGEVGHLEGDLIVGSFNRSAIATVFDRASRHVWLAKLGNGHGADEVLYALSGLIDRIPEPWRRTLTWDQGREMARHDELAKITGIDVFFAEPHSPWQRPTNENGNGLLRRYVGKGTDLNIYTESDLRRIERRLNTMPRRTLAWETAQDVYNRAVALTG